MFYIIYQLRGVRIERGKAEEREAEERKKDKRAGIFVNSD